MGGEIYADETRIISANKLSAHRPINRISASLSGLKCVYLNARSIVSKMDELRRMADDTKPDIIGITETWTKPDMGDAEFGLAGYKMFRKDRLVKRGGGGGGGGDAIFQRTYSGI